MSDLDDLASAARTGASRPPPPNPDDVRYVPAEEGIEFEKIRGGGATVWVCLAVGAAIVMILGFSYLIIQHNTGGSSEPAPPPVAASPARSASQTPDESSQPTLGPGSSAKAKNIPLEEISNPIKALEIIHLKRGAGDTLEIRARNRSTRGLFVKSVEIFAESNQTVALDNLGFWLPVGGAVSQARKIPELSRYLKHDEKVIAVINEAEFRDTEPPDLVDRPGGYSTPAPTSAP